MGPSTMYHYNIYHFLSLYPCDKAGIFFILTKCLSLFLFPNQVNFLFYYHISTLSCTTRTFIFHLFLSLCSYLYLSYIYSYLLPDTADVYFYFSLYNNFMYFFPNWYHPDTPSELWFPYHTIPSTRGQGESKRCSKKKKRIKVMHISKCKPCQTCWQL